MSVRFCVPSGHDPLPPLSRKLKICIRAFSVSATYSSPLLGGVFLSIASPVGALNVPFVVPVPPNSPT